MTEKVLLIGTGMQLSRLHREMGDIEIKIQDDPPDPDSFCYDTKSKKNGMFRNKQDWKKAMKGNK
jgi:hypothetical protein